jgi:gluconokinase
MESSDKRSNILMILVMGVSGSGKTTVGRLLARRLDFQFVDADHFHSPANKAKMNQGIPLTDADRLPWLQAITTKTNALVAKGHRVVLACSALTVSYREILINDKGFVPILFLDGSDELFAERLAQRKNHFFNNNLLKSQLMKLQKPKTAIYLDASETPEEIVEVACHQLEPYLARGSGS